MDDIAATNRAHWDRMATEGCGFSRPWLDLTPEMVRAYARGQVAAAPQAVHEMHPLDLLARTEGRDVLCLASGGGQQSAVFGLLGARVTVVDLSERQLQGDAAAARHYGYKVKTVLADMRDLSSLPL